MASEDEYEEFLANLNPEVREVATKYPLLRDGKLACYRSSVAPELHFAIITYEPRDRGVEITIVHGRDSTLPGMVIATFNYAHLNPCDCGSWEPPTPEQLERTKAVLDALRVCTQSTTKH